jgi:hypothetical protein
MTQRFGIGRRLLMRWGRALAQGSTVLGIAMIGLVWASVGFHLTSERQSAERAAIENAGNLARAFEAHLSQSLHDIDRTLDMMRAYYLRDPAGFDFRAWVDNSQMVDKDLLQLVLIGPARPASTCATASTSRSMSIRTRTGCSSASRWSAASPAAPRSSSRAASSAPTARSAASSWRRSTRPISRGSTIRSRSAAKAISG